jgi:hypothetical protein
MATETRTRYRSGVSGKYVQKDTARRSPKTTVTERDKVKTTRKKKKKPPVRASSSARSTTRRGRSTHTTRR